MSDALATNVPDWSRFRADFPVLAQEIDGHPLAYLDNAATSQKPRAVLDAMTHFYERDNANVHRGTHTLGQRATGAFEAVRVRVARFINAASPEEIVFTRGTTEGINLVAQAWAGAMLKPGDRIVLTEMEHHGNLVPWQLIAQRTGAEIAFAPITGDEGLLDLDALDELLIAPTRLLAFVHVSNTLGTVNPAAEICARARARGIVTLVDAAQSAGHLPLDVAAFGSDFLVFSGHKMCGPTGIGVLHGRREMLAALPPWHGGGEMIRDVDFGGASFADPPARFEAGTPNIAGAIGLAAAMDYLEAIGREWIFAHDRLLADEAVERLRSIDGLRLLGPKHGRAGVITFALRHVHSHDLVTLADQAGIALRGGHHCAQPLTRRLQLGATTRASFYLYNTRTEIDRLVDVVQEAVRIFRT